MGVNELASWSFFSPGPDLSERASQDGPRTIPVIGRPAWLGLVKEDSVDAWRGCGTRPKRSLLLVQTRCCPPCTTPFRQGLSAHGRPAGSMFSLRVILSSLQKLLRRHQSSLPAPPHPAVAARTPLHRRRPLLPRVCSNSSREAHRWKTSGLRG